MSFAQQSTTFCVLHLIKTDSVVKLQLAFPKRFGIDSQLPRRFVSGIAGLKKQDIVKIVRFQIKLALLMTVHRIQPGLRKGP